MKNLLGLLFVSFSLLVGSSAHANNLVKNGDFSSGFDDWTTTVTWGELWVGLTPSLPSATLFIGSTGPDTGLGLANISQTIQTVAGQKYLVSWDYWISDGAYWDGTGGGTGMLRLSGAPYSMWAGTSTAGHNQFSFLARSASTTLDFELRTDWALASIDNVSVTAVPEPEAFALMLAGLGLLGGVVRRRKL